MTHALTPLRMTTCGLVVPVAIADAGDDATRRFLEFFTAQIRNPNTRAAYGRAAAEFLGWWEGQGRGGLAAIEPIHVAAWVELRGRTHAPQTVKQQLAALRNLFDWLVTGHVLRHNPAAPVRGPKHSAAKGKTPILVTDEARRLFRAIPTDTVVGLRDRALIGLMTYTFARIGAALAMDVRDVFPKNHRLWVRLHEKGGKVHDMPCHHTLEIYLREYIEASGLAADPKGPLFRSIDRTTKQLGDRRLHRSESLRMVQRRARAAGIETPGLGNHTFRGTGITAYLSNPDAKLEHAQQMAAHSDPKTTRLYDRRCDEVSLNEVERIGI